VFFSKWVEYSEEVAMRYIAIIVFVLVTAGLAVLAFENFLSDVSLTLIFWSTPPLPLGWILFLSFLLGDAMLFLVAVAAAMDERRELKRLRGRVKELEGKVANISAVQSSAGSPNVSMPGMGIPVSKSDISYMTTLH